VAQMGFFPVVNPLHQAAADSADDRATGALGAVETRGPRRPPGTMQWAAKPGSERGAGFVRGADGPDVLFSGLSNSTGRWPNRVDEHQAILYQPGFFTGI
jgi:hypothetical protein